jgi:hypothetical protein
VATIQSSSNNETLDLPGPASHGHSQDLSGDMLVWDDFFPPDPCVLSPCAQLPEDNIWSADSEEEMIVHYPACQVQPAEIAELIVPGISQTGQFNWDSGVDGEDNDEFTSYLSSPLESETCTWMVGLAWLPRRSRTLITLSQT